MAAYDVNDPTSDGWTPRRAEGAVSGQPTGTAGGGSVALRQYISGQPAWFGSSGFYTASSISLGYSAYTAFVVEKAITISHIDIKLGATVATASLAASIYNCRANGLPNNRMHSAVTAALCSSVNMSFALDANLSLAAGVYWMALNASGTGSNPTIHGGYQHAHAMPIPLANVDNTQNNGAIRVSENTGLAATSPLSSWSGVVMLPVMPTFGLRIV